MDELETIVEKWTYFFKHAEETKEQDLEKIVGSDKVIQRAYEELNRFSWSEIELNTYEQVEKRERDAQAIAEQRALELEQKLLEIKQKSLLEVEAAKLAAKLEVEAGKLEVEAGKLEVEAGKLEVEAGKLEVEAAKTKYIEKGIEQVAGSLKQAGWSMEEIAKLTGLTKTQIDAL